MRQVSVIISTHNELSTGVINNSLNLLCKNRDIEVIVVDGNSQDGTLELLKNFPITVLHSKANSRAHRLNEGIQKASHSPLLLHHPRSVLEEKAITHLQTAENLPLWGSFTHKFDIDHPLFHLLFGSLLVFR